MRLEGKHAFVTGAANGLGKAIVERLASEGATITCADLNEEGAQEVAASLPNASAVAIDVGSEESINAALAASIDAYGTPQILVNSAGVGMQKPALETTAEDFARVHRINVIGSFLLCREVAKRQIAEDIQGSLINISSVAGLRGGAGRSAYGSSKAAANNMTQVLATELAKHRIRVNAVAPGPVETDMVRETHTPESRESWTRSIPTGKYGLPEDIAGAVFYLASDDSRNVFGQVIAVDGGFAGAGVIFDT